MDDRRGAVERARGGGEDRTELAEDRTSYAADRTALANERTASAWIRTGIAALIAGYGVVRFLGGTLPGWAIQATAAICMIAALAAFALSAWRYRRLGGTLAAANVRTIPFWLIALLNLLLGFAALLGLASLWLL